MTKSVIASPNPGTGIDQRYWNRIVASARNDGKVKRLAGFIEHAVWWQIYPLGFVGAEREAAACPEVRHRLTKIVDWLDYAIDLGVSGLLLAPIFASSTH